MTQQKNYPVTRCQAITDIFRSIAKEEETLADILEKVKNRPSHGKDSECYSDYDYDSSSDKHKKDDKEDKELKLVNAVARIQLLLTFKAAIFLDCACPKDGCKDHEKHDYN